MIADYCGEIKIANLQSVSKRQGDEWRSSSNCGRIGVNYEIIRQKFTKFVHDVAKMLPFILFTIDQSVVERRSRVKVVSGNVCEHLQNLTGCVATSLGRPLNEYRDNHPHQYAYQTCEVGQDRSRKFWDIWRDMAIFAVSPQKVLLLTA